jgi:hypothetical protein
MRNLMADQINWKIETGAITGNSSEPDESIPHPHIVFTDLTLNNLVLTNYNGVYSNNKFKLENRTRKW